MSVFGVVFTSVVQLLSSILYLLFIIYMMFVEVQSLIRLKCEYFRQFWSYIDVGLIVCAWTSVGIYVWRYQEMSRISNQFEQTHGYAGVNLQAAVYASNVFMYLLAFSCFFATLNFIRLCRFNHRLMFFVRTLQRAAKELLSFMTMFSIVYLGFLTLFYLLFVAKLSNCATLLRTAQMLFEMTLMKFDAHELSAVASFLGPFVFTLFIFVVVFVCMSMFLSIISDTFRDVREQTNANMQYNQDIASFIIDKLQRLIGKCDQVREEGAVDATVWLPRFGTAERAETARGI